MFVRHDETSQEASKDSMDADGRREERRSSDDHEYDDDDSLWNDLFIGFERAIFDKDRADNKVEEDEECNSREEDVESH